jgi:membrane protease YdiL (CAAX protease family)
MMHQTLATTASAFAEIIAVLGKSPVPMNQDTVASIGLAVLLAVIVINGILLGIWGIRRLFHEKPTFQRHWSYLDLWLVPQIIAHLFGVLLVPLMFLAMPDAKTTEEMMSNVGFILPMLFIQNIVFFGVPAAFVRWKYQLPLREIGLPRLPKRRDVLLGVGLGICAIVVSLPLEYGLTALAKHYSYLPWVAAGLKMEQSLPINALIESITKQGVGVLLLAALAIGPGPGFGEEMLFRGFLFGLLKRRLGLWPGIILSGFVFAAVHGYFIGFLPVFLLGMALAALYHKTGSLWTCIILHATNNSVLVLLAYLFPSLSQ